MYWRSRRADCQRNYGDGNKRAFKALVDSGRTTGFLAYHGRRPVAWCAVAPRKEFPVLERSRTLKPIDDKPAWSITCFFVSKPYRRAGMTGALIREAVRFAAKRGARMIEAYPLENETTNLLPYERYMGIKSTYIRAGFKVAAQRSARRSIMRYSIKANP
jgi:GNAT superfamily N-acetyltransferase